MQNLRALVICTLLVLLSSFTTAWPWPPFEDLVKRESITSFAPAIPVSSSTSGQSNSGAAATSGSGSTSGSDSNAPSPTTSGGKSKSGSATGSKTASGSKITGSTASNFSTIVDPRAPPGGIQMQTPGPLSGSQYYKIGDWVTLAWNYTSLKVTPTAVNVVASCATNNEIYTITSNMSVSETGAVLWDTAPFLATATPLLTSTYTLIVYDAAKPITAAPSPGYLAPFGQFVFGMYLGQPYQDLSGFTCATCSAANSLLDPKALRFLLGMAAITVASFTWFAAGVFF